MKKDAYKDFETFRRNYFEKMKADYLFAVQIARKKLNAHHNFEQTEMRKESGRFQKELGQESRFLIEIRNAMELDSRIEERDEFNRRFYALPEKGRDEFLKQIAEYEGLHLMYNFWHRKGVYLNAIENRDSDPVEFFIQIEEDLTRSFENILEIRQRGFLQSLEMRIAPDEKLSFVQSQISNTRNRIENDLLYRFYNAFNQHHEKVFEIVFSNFRNFDNVGLTIFGDLSEQANTAIEALLKHCLSAPDEDNKKEFAALIKSLKAQGIESPALANALNTKFENSEHRFLYVPFYFYYEKRFLVFLQDQLAEVRLNFIEDNPKSGEEMERNREFTTHRQVLAIHYLMEELRVYQQADKTNIARFIQFLTSKETGAKRIADTNIYNKLKNPLDKNDKNLKADLVFVRGYFEKLNMQGIVDKINQDLDHKE